MTGKERQRLVKTLSRCCLNIQHYFQNYVETAIKLYIVDRVSKTCRLKNFNKSDLVFCYVSPRDFYIFPISQEKSKLISSDPRYRVNGFYCSFVVMVVYESLPTRHISSAYQLSGWTRFLGTKSHRAFSTGAE